MKYKVHYEIYKDMKKYIPDIDPDMFEKGYANSDPDVIESVRNYYDAHLPVDLIAWLRVNDPDEYLVFGKKLGNQVGFVKDDICDILSRIGKIKQEIVPLVIAVHYSNSVKLPVYQINLEKYGVEIVLRNNFYDWVISIKSEKPLDFEVMGLLEKHVRQPNYFGSSGIPFNKLYGAYAENKSQFTFEIRKDYDLYAYMYLLASYLKARK